MSKQQTKPVRDAFHSLLSVAGSRRHGPSARRLGTPLCLERLEERTLLSTFTVTDNSDNANDPGSIRFAIDHLSADGNNTISFAPP